MGYFERRWREKKPHLDVVTVGECRHHVDYDDWWDGKEDSYLLIINTTTDDWMKSE
jgi:hypothetical protein